jgi:CDP-diacylglycerol--glycerol-3-phosphate 3-phosphatidyltransferase
VPSIYALKPKFQGVLRPIAAWLARVGVTANQVTIAACALSVALGLWLSTGVERQWWLVLPAFLFVRMAMNAIDGMLAREFGQKSDLGAYLNELTDVASDAALYLPFALTAPFDGAWMAAAIWMAAMSEMAGTVGVMVGASRRYDGPMGKSDRAFVFGALALWMGLGGGLAPWFGFWFPRALAGLLALTTVNRVRQGLVEIRCR